MKWALLVLGVLAGVVALAAIVGASLPKGHLASRSATYRQPPEAIWSAITDFAGQAAWRTDVRSVERLADRSGHEVWREIDKHNQALPLETVEAIAPRRLVRRIADPDLPFGGTWTYEITPAPGGSRLTLTENGEVRNPFFRFMARFVFGYTATMEGYLKALGRKFREDVLVS